MIISGLSLKLRVCFFEKTIVGFKLNQKTDFAGVFFYYN